MFQPTSDRVLVRLTVGQQITPAGIIIPPSAQELQSHGTVLAVGPDAAKDLEPGMRVLVSDVAGTIISDGKAGREILYNLRDIQAIIED